MGQLQQTDCINCKKALKHWIEFQLVDEQGEPLTGIPYKLTSRNNKSLVRTGTTDGKGLLREENLPPMPVTLSVTAQSLADEIVKRTPRQQTGEANSPVKPAAILDGHEYQYMTLGMLSDGYPKIKGWQDDELKSSEHFKDSTLKGFSTSQLNRRHVLEIQVIESGINLTIGVFFDGTGNNVDNTDERLCAKEKSDPTPEQFNDFMCSLNKYGKPGDVWRLSYDNYYTNVVFLHKLYRTNEISAGNHQIKVYINGVGTKSGESDSVIGYGTGRGDTGVVTKTDIGIEKIKEVLTEFLDKTKDNIRTLQFDIIGFSRGAASSRHFANRVLKQDKDLLKALNECFVDHRYLENPRYPTGKTRFLGIYDTVTAIAEMNNLLNPHNSSVTGRANIFLSPDIAKSVFHITAQNECRYNFSLNSVKPHWPELELPGAHADVGGGYDPVSDESLCITRPKSMEVSGFGIPSDNKLYVYKNTQKELEQLKKSPTIGSLVTDENVELITWHDDSSEYARRTGSTKIMAAAVLTRTIQNDWSKVGMLVMQDAAQEAGLVFNKPDNKDGNYQLPEELQSIAKKAIAQGLSIRQGQKPEPFTQEELKLIWSKYTHFSANWNNSKTKDNEKQGDILPAEIAYANRPNSDWRRTIFDNNGKDIS
ncbi:phospholipase effector Tle1 domain-containing protein [Xenorhabdus sp. BG5]|uniref:phospholipase effector Tle1 domain-containing protein n=1 Tax=Xenorhabdus sp. BG5 TaxID=2782014 RepID=UPI0018812006|nr:DUF2235 domain-containing protein [Xenorhabdus sp. BG5]MBE8598235.1 DUF2235 domain-containing protein [Xenorhabdus sp. BG5]